MSSGIFQGMNILILQTFLGKKRLTLFESRVVKEGGYLCSFSEVASGQTEPTLVVVEDSLLQDFSKLEQHSKGLYNPSRKFVGTRWLSDSLKQLKCLPTKGYEFVHNICECVSVESSDALSSPPKKLKLSENENVVDCPEKCIKGSIDVDKFACSQSSTSSSKNSEGNEVVIQELQKLADAFRNKGDTWRAHGYLKAISAIKRCGRVLSSYEDAVSLPGVGDKIASKVWEILETGSLRKVREVCEDDRTRCLEIFTNIWGVGPSTAESWFQLGCRTLDDIKEKISLSKQQQIGLKYYDEFLERIPRCEVEEVGQMVAAAAKTLEPSLSVTLVGSYRRGKSSCGDIDVMISKPDHLDSAEILSQLLSSLKSSGLVTDDLVTIAREGNQRKYLGVCYIPGEDRKHRRLDIFVVPKSEFAPALMHYTGSALFNRSIRLLAAKKGMSLSEHSLHGGIVREGLKILNEGYPIPTPSEQSIFEALDLAYRPPEERDH